MTNRKIYYVLGYFYSFDIILPILKSFLKRKEVAYESQENIGYVIIHMHACRMFLSHCLC